MKKNNLTSNLHQSKTDCRKITMSMNVLRFSLVLFAVCMLSGLFCRPTSVCAQAAPGIEQKRPNMLLVTLDTVRADHVGCYGYKRATTPTIDRLAQQGTTFTRAFSNIPWTTPSHFCFLTGAHVARHGSRDNLRNRRGIQGRDPVMGHLHVRVIRTPNGSHIPRPRMVPLMSGVAVPAQIQYFIFIQLPAAVKIVRQAVIMMPAVIARKKLQDFR
jgi:hypothetical protein